MSDKIGLMAALGILGVNATEQNGLLRLGVAKFAVQGGGMVETNNEKVGSMNISSFVGVIVDFTPHEENQIIESGKNRYQAYHELLQGTLYIDLQRRDLDVGGNLIGYGLAGLATDGGLHHSMYGKRVK